MKEKTDYYLLENTAESLQMNQNIKALIESKEYENMILALQMLETGGVSFDTITHIFALQKWCKNTYVRNQAKYLFNKFASRRLQTFVRDTWKKEYLFETNEGKISKFLTILSGSYELSREDLGNIYLNLTGKGAKFCIENQTVAITQILEQIIEQNELHLANFQLQICPKEIADFPDLRTLDISGNRFKTLPKELKKLENLKWVYYKETPISETILLDTFPHIFAMKYMNTAIHWQNKQKYSLASDYFNKTIKLESNYPEAWQGLAECLYAQNRVQEAKSNFQRALEKYALRIQKIPDIAWDFFQQARIYAFLQKKELMYKNLKQALILDKTFDKIAQTDMVFKEYKEEKKFKNITS